MLKDEDYAWKWNEVIIAHEEKKRTAVDWIHLIYTNEIQQEIAFIKLIDNLFQFEASSSDSDIKH